MLEILGFGSVMYDFFSFLFVFIYYLILHASHCNMG